MSPLVQETFFGVHIHESSAATLWVTGSLHRLLHMCVWNKQNRNVHLLVFISVSVTLCASVGILEGFSFRERMDGAELIWSICVTTQKIACCKQSWKLGHCCRDQRDAWSNLHVGFHWSMASKRGLCNESSRCLGRGPSLSQSHGQEQRCQEASSEAP